MPVGLQLSVTREVPQRRVLPVDVVAGDVIHHPRREDKEAAVDQAALLGRLLDEGSDPIAVQIQRAKAGGWAYRGDRRQLAVRDVELDRRGDIEIGHTV